MKKTGLVLFVLLFAVFTMSKMSYAKEEKISYPISLTDGKDAAGKVVLKILYFWNVYGNQSLPAEHMREFHLISMRMDSFRQGNVNWFV